MFDPVTRAELIQLCQTLVQTPSVNGSHPERAVAEQVVVFAHRHGLQAELHALHSERPNVLVRVGPPGTPGLLLVAHTDTVAAGRADAWTYPPFSGTLSDGRLYGRGAVDNKGGLVAALAAMLLLQRGVLGQLQRPVLLIGVPDEESGATGTLGVRYLHERGLLVGSGAIYTYPGSRELIVGHRGVLRLKLVARGKAYHSGARAWQQAAPGANALTGLAEILLALESQRFPDSAPATLFAPFRTMVTPTTISGGSGPSMVPDQCTALVDIRLVPAVPREQVEAALREIIAAVCARRPPLEVQVGVETYLPPTEIAPDTAIVGAVRQAVLALRGSELPLKVSGPANESYLLNGMGIPTCVIGPDGDNVHAADEYLVLDTLFEVAQVYARTALLL